MNHDFRLAAVVIATSLWAVSASHAQVVAPRPPVQPQAGTTIAVIDINYIFKNHQRFKKSLDGIQDEVQAFENYLQQERESLTQKAARLMNAPPESREYKALEEEIAQRRTELSLEANRKRKEILEREAMLYYNAYREIEDRVAAFANRNGIDLVLRYDSQEMDPSKRESVLQGVNRNVVFQRSLDITQYILGEG